LFYKKLRIKTLFYKKLRIKTLFYKKLGIKIVVCLLRESGPRTGPI